MIVGYAPLSCRYADEIEGRRSGATLPAFTNHLGRDLPTVLHRQFGDFTFGSVEPFPMMLPKAAEVFGVEPDLLVGELLPYRLYTANGLTALASTPFPALSTTMLSRPSVSSVFRVASGARRCL